jgi:hypothetical protein
VLLPVTVLLRRAYAAEVIGAALLARAGGQGHRSIGAALKVPAATVRGWLRVMAGRLDLARVHLLQVAHRAGVDITVPEAFGCPWRDLLAALGAATAALTGRFGPVGVLGPVTAWQVAAACSAGRLVGGVGLNGCEHGVVAVGGGAGQTDRPERGAFPVGDAPVAGMGGGDEGDDVGQERVGGDLPADETAGL